jgi:hypothetical protein
MANTLHVYGDESGIMPINDDGDLFVYACIAIPGNITIAKRDIGKIDHITDYLRSINGTPFIGIIQPYAGYGNALISKIAKMDVMARITRILTKANAQYIPKEGIANRNWIWISCAQLTVSAAIRNSLYRTSVNYVKVVMDEKSLQSEFRYLMRTTIRNLPNVVRDIAHDNPGAYSTEVVINSNMLFSGKDINVSWSDERISEDDVNGLSYLTH